MQPALADIVDISAILEAPCANWSSLGYIFRLVSSTQYKAELKASLCLGTKSHLIHFEKS